MLMLDIKIGKVYKKKLMNKHIILVIISSIFFSCANKVDSSKKNKDNIIKEHLRGNDTSLRKCILEKDTLIDEINSVKYVVVDSFYTLKIQVGGLDTILPYQFNCSVPRGLVPSFHSFYKNTICLIKGAGQHFKVFTICYADSNRIIVKEYETALTTDLRNDIVVYQNYDSPEIVNIEHIRTKSRKVFTIPSRFLSKIVSKATIEKQKLTLKFSDNKEFYFSLR